MSPPHPTTHEVSVPPPDLLQVDERHPYVTGDSANLTTQTAGEKIIIQAWPDQCAHLRNPFKFQKYLRKEVKMVTDRRLKAK